MELKSAFITSLMGSVSNEPALKPAEADTTGTPRRLFKEHALPQNPLQDSRVLECAPVLLWLGVD